MAEAVDSLSHKDEALSSNPCTVKKKKTSRLKGYNKCLLQQMEKVPLSYIFVSVQNTWIKDAQPKY
jgi:hypothetical protein